MLQEVLQDYETFVENFHSWGQFNILSWIFDTLSYLWKSLQYSDKQTSCYDIHIQQVHMLFIFWNLNALY